MNRVILCLLGVTLLYTTPATAEMHPGLGRFMQRDPWSYRDGSSLFCVYKSNPIKNTDPGGLVTVTDAIVATPQSLRCCANAMKDPNDPEIGEMRTVCCGEQIVICNFLGGPWQMWPKEDVDPLNPQGEFKEAYGLIEECALNHEKEHVKQSQPCGDGGGRCRPDDWPFDPDTSPLNHNDAECYAYAVEIDCLIGKRAKCTTVECQRLIDDRIAKKLQKARTTYGCRY